MEMCSALIPAIRKMITTSTYCNNTFGTIFSMFQTATSKKKKVNSKCKEQFSVLELNDDYDLKASSQSWGTVSTVTVFKTQLELRWIFKKLVLWRRIKNQNVQFSDSKGMFYATGAILLSADLAAVFSLLYFIPDMISLWLHINVCQICIWLHHSFHIPVI